MSAHEVENGTGTVYSAGGGSGDAAALAPGGTAAAKGFRTDTSRSPAGLIRERLLRAANVLFILFFVLSLIPDAVDETYSSLTAGLMILIEVIFLAISLLGKNREHIINFGKNVAVIYFIIDAWIVLTQKTTILDTRMFPVPGVVINQLFADYQELFAAVGNSLKTVFSGFLLAAVIAIPMGLILGWFKAVRSPANFVIHFFSAIPPIVFIPYGIALLPTFQAASVFVIFIASYWPILSGTMSGISNIEKGVLDTARALNVGTGDMLRSIVLPASLPHIFSGAVLGLSFSFIMLTSAEMIGSDTEHPGLGYYIQLYANFGDFPRVILGIILLGTIISLISLVFRKVQEHLLRWQQM